MALVPYTANRSLKRAYADYSYPMVKRQRKNSTMPYIPRPMSRSLQPYRRGRSGSGPYRQLTNVSRHTNPIYPRPECKSIDLSQTGAIFAGTPSGTSVSSTGFINIINNISQGTNNQQRVGLSVATKSVAYRYEVDMQGTGPVNGRTILLWDRQPNAAPATIADVLNGSSYLSYMNLAAKDRFTVLRNDLWSLNPNGNTTVFFEGYVRVNMQTTYAGTSSTPVSGALLLLCISDFGPVSNIPTVVGCWRIRYYDN